MTDPVTTTQPNETGRPSPVLVVLLIVPLVGILMALLMIALSPRQPELALPTVGVQAASLINFTAPPFDVLDLNGEVFSLLDYRGRVVFLNFWQTTCAPCEVEMPDLARFSREQGDEGAAVIAINFGETNETVRNWLAARDIVGLKVGMDYESRIQRAYGVLNLPTTFVIDPEGRIVYMKLGVMSLEEMYEYADSVTAAAG
jgi:cytochrome c biogenesis protein CcmG/thiol:disulfide interchange protein DsbE